MKRLDKIDVTLAILTLMIFGYVSSYVVIRRNNTLLMERDYHPPDATVVYLPQGDFYSFYKPLILIDERLTHTEFIFTNEKLKWN